MITLQSDRAFGELREFLKRQNIFKYGLILTQIPSLLLIVQLTESKWYNLVVLPILSSTTNHTAEITAWATLHLADKKKQAHAHIEGADYIFTIDWIAILSVRVFSGLKMVIQYCALDLCLSYFKSYYFCSYISCRSWRPMTPYVLCNSCKYNKEHKWFQTLEDDCTDRDIQHLRCKLSLMMQLYLTNVKHLSPSVITLTYAVSPVCDPILPVLASHRSVAKSLWYHGVSTLMYSH